LLVSHNIGTFLRAGRQRFVLFCFFFNSRDIANQGFAIFPMKVRKYIMKVKHSASLLFRLINANISVNEQPEWFHHWAHRRWPFYTHCTSRTHFRSWSFYRYLKRFGDLEQWPWQVEKTLKKHGCTSSPRILKMTVIVYDNKHLRIIDHWIRRHTAGVYFIYFIYQ
jgi:hypothetical protein